MSAGPLAADTSLAPIAPSTGDAHRVVVDSVHQTDRIDDHGTGGGRAVPYHCPFCADEDLRPHGTTHGAWHCRACLRVFAVRFLGLAGLQPTADTPSPSVAVPGAGPSKDSSDGPAAPTPTTTGGSR